MKTLAGNGHHALFGFGLWVDQWITRLSPWVMVVLMILACVWIVEPAPETTVSIRDTYQVSAGSEVSIHPPLIVESKTERRAIYNVFLTDAAGNVVYTYPQHMNVEIKGFAFEKIDLVVPNLRPGTYTAHVQMIYKFNPFKNGVVDARIGFLEVN
ncbi:hypothetical protein BcepSauron_284 [Burkholderia phage BcepSauron]|uniref:Uncharacterized protein n=1 Tax=Burkholderia phage BcepSauron TaxID=2530033 RepID=A0A482MLQ5_9CAUD|nr:hypothetical protein H1O17_gp284 [Burkholderia phage BcepSauron]QBQ74664.1 hypothetical protein BcepSauron_284 [Burkholderia phage BcepSauron]